MGNPELDQTPVHQADTIEHVIGTATSRLPGETEPLRPKTPGQTAGEYFDAPPPVGPSAIATADYRPMINDFAKMGSDALVKKTGCNLIALKREERETLAERFNPLMQKYFPHLSEGEISIELSAAVCVISMAWAKWSIYRDWKATQKAQVPTETQHAGNA